MLKINMENEMHDLCNSILQDLTAPDPSLAVTSETEEMPIEDAAIKIISDGIECGADAEEIVNHLINAWII